MAWIESHQELGGHPKTRKLAATLGVHRMQVVGHLHALWWWALDYAEDGDLSSFDHADIAIGAEWDGDPDEFVSALQACGPGDRPGFLEPDMSLHDWHDYAGKLVERRKKDRERKQASRSRPKDVRGTSNGQTEEVQSAANVPNPTEPNTTEPTSPNPSVTQLPAERWARRWCELMGLPQTRAVLKFMVPKAQDYIAEAGEPTEGLLKRAKAAGIRTPGGWGFISSPQKETVPDWLESHWNQGGPDE